MTSGSLWLDGLDAPQHPPLGQDLDADVCVIGGGIFGLTTALEVARGGRSVVLLERDRVGAGVTGHSTAKLSALQGTTYTELSRRFGVDGARGYAALNEGAIGYVVDRVGTLGLADEVEIRRAPHALFSWDAKQREDLEREADAARAAGLDVRLTDDDLGLPFATTGALVREDQAELEIGAYMRGLADAFTAIGGRIFERTVATHVGEGSRPVVRTEAGPRVTAGDVVVATHYPILDRGLFFPRLTPKRSYCIAVAGADPLPEGLMAISIGSPMRSLRVARGLLVLGGEGGYDALADFARAHFGGSKVEVTHRWLSHDMTSADGLPFAGRLTPFSRHVWVGTGFRKWGLTNGTAAAQIVAARLLGATHPHGELFDTLRFTPLRSAPSVLKEGARDAMHFVGDRFKRPEGDSLDALTPGGEGKILKVDGELVAASKDADGTVHAVSPVCTHLGCRVAFNGAERTWDCPCHGSRFAVDGTVLEGPAVAPLKAKPLSYEPQA
ncbi:FAD-dependent oxidoreductase [Baekduia sp. Peel2402]|uniref:FAD-dependent oxidoreductase n=1 Tax=Baekduia sp. Peel2402 TaxID=3458296 RepID=UPI00403E725E